MSKLSERDVEFIKYLADLKVPYRRIAEFHLKRRISHMTAYRVVHGKNVTASNTEPENQEREVDPTRNQLQEIQDHEPVNFLDFHSGLGSEMSRFEKYRIIRNSCGETKDIGVRERILGQYLTKDFDSRLRKLLEAGSRTLKQLNLENEPYLGNALGVLLRKIYRTRYARKRRNVNYKRVVHSSLAYLLQWHADYQSRIKPNLKIDTRIVKLCARLTGVYSQRV